MAGVRPHFFIVGPLRTGSSLMARCIDDHEDVISFCESEINRALFPDYSVHLHARRMTVHGFQADAILQLLDRKRQSDLDDLLLWYDQAFALAKTVYGKRHVKIYGDKSPDFYLSRKLVSYLIRNAQLIYTVRDPRAVLRSILKQDIATIADKDQRWQAFRNNFLCWERYLDRPNVLVSRYEDLILDPKATMARVYAHLGIRPSTRFLEPFPRLHPRRFLWETAVDWTSGVAKAFDPGLARVSDDDLAADDRARIYDDKDVRRFMERFGYARAAAV